MGEPLNGVVHNLAVGGQPPTGISGAFPQSSGVGQQCIGRLDARNLRLGNLPLARDLNANVFPRNPEVGAQQPGEYVTAFLGRLETEAQASRDGVIASAQSWKPETQPLDEEPTASLQGSEHGGLPLRPSPSDFDPISDFTTL